MSDKEDTSAPVDTSALTSLFATQEPIPTVPEAVLRKKKSIELYKQNKEANELEKQKRRDRARRQKINFKRAEYFINDFRKVRKAENRTRRVEKSGKGTEIHKDVQLILVVRTKDATAGVDHKSQKILNSWALHKMYFARLIRVTDESRKKLQIIEPFVTFGYPTLKTVKDLVYKRGYTRATGERKAITSNDLVEEKLGEHDIICVEDVVNELFTVGEHFDQVNRFLMPFKLSQSKVIEGTKVELKDKIPKPGNRKEKINDLVQSMN